MEIFLNREHFCRQINRAMYIMHNTHLAIDWTNNELCVNNTRTSQINFVAHCMSIRPFKMIVIHLQVEKINPIILQCCAKNKARQPFMGYFFLFCSKCCFKAKCSVDIGEGFGNYDPGGNFRLLLNITQKLCGELCVVGRLPSN